LLKANKMIVELKDGVRIPRSPKLTPDMKHGPSLSLEAYQTILDLNQQTEEMENILQNSIEVLVENELLLQAELSKKDEYIQAYKSAVDYYENSELSYRSMLSLINSKLERKYDMVAESNQSEELITFLKEKNEYLMAIIEQTPIIMSTYHQNVDLREKLDFFEGEYNPTSTLAIAKQLGENSNIFKEFSKKIDVNFSKCSFNQ
jgi:hypothetical protein